jgi:hypothetical protein
VVALVERLDGVDQPIEVLGAVDERLDEVALGPGRQRRRRIAALLGGQQPVGGGLHAKIT